ncbi:hypothetical protein IGB42_02618 [Andreprevotia sp. IGB-42]|uniref:helix-turn-helix domain-containing protein n=1 Tax=Andreprevotia sp. IGB-42 TaxID=2497473 RepID=UPI0013596A75|nr:helix-turn-helix transcriptional regulator [Andreprevotia sp. IGB-42]KAF0812775.1 hypothetical protein IGB42_02618 [Andreprevotia sp. IGB-42]
MTDKQTTPLRLARKQSQKTLQQVAAEVGCSDGFLSQLERGNENCSPALAEKLVAFYAVAWLTELHVLYPERYMPEASGMQTH